MGEGILSVPEGLVGVQLFMCNLRVRPLPCLAVLITDQVCTVMFDGSWLRAAMSLLRWDSPAHDGRCSL